MAEFAKLCQHVHSSMAILLGRKQEMTVEQERRWKQNAYGCMSLLGKFHPYEITQYDNQFIFGIPWIVKYAWKNHIEDGERLALFSTESGESNQIMSKWFMANKNHFRKGTESDPLAHTWTNTKFSVNDLVYDASRDQNIYAFDATHRPEYLRFVRKHFEFGMSDLFMTAAEYFYQIKLDPDVVKALEPIERMFEGKAFGAKNAQGFVMRSMDNNHYLYDKDMIEPADQYSQDFRTKRKKQEDQEEKRDEKRKKTGTDASQAGT